jgi:hypothetical protein
VLRPMPAAPRMYLIVVYRPLPAAPLVVCCMLHAHGRGARADAFGRSFVDAVFSSWLALKASSAKADACGRSFVVLSTQVSTVGLRQG